MREFQEQKIARRLVHSKVFLVAALILLLIVSNATFNLYQKYKESVTRREAVEHQLASLGERTETLTVDIEKLNTPSGVEEEIRRQFNMAKNGEELVIIVDEKIEPPATKEVPGGWLKKLFNVVGI